MSCRGEVRRELGEDGKDLRWREGRLARACDMARRRIGADGP